MKKILILIILALGLPVAAEEAGTQPTTQVQNTSAQNITFNNCIKFFEVNTEKLFFLTLSSITSNKYTIDEIQTANGYIIFNANHRKFLATVAKVDNLNSILKITPCNNVYNFSPMIVTNIFNYIDTNSKGNS